MGAIYRKKIPYGGGSSETVENYVAGTGITIGEDKVIATKDIKKNYIDNSNFRINQNGATEYSTPNEYTVDRWYIDGGVLTPVENGVQFVNPNTESGASTLVRLRQNIHYGFSEFAGKTVTLSAKINGVIYSGKTTIPTEKPTEGAAVQYITVGIADFSINLNYSVTADYFVPYFAVAYSRTALIEWMKLEVNDEFSGYIEPDYMTELIKMNFTTSDKGALDIPTGGSYDDTEIKENIATLETSVKSKLDKTGDASSLIYSSPDFSAFQRSEQGVAMGEYERLGLVLNNTEFIGAENQGKLTGILFIKEIDGVIYIGGSNGFGTMSSDMSTYTPILYTQDYGKMLDILDVEKVETYEGDIMWVMTARNTEPYCYNVKEGTLEPIMYEPSLSMFQPVKIVKDATRGENQTRVYFVQFENNPQIGCFEGTPNYIMKSVIFSNDFQKMGSLTDFVAFEEGDTMRMFCCIGSDIFFKINSQSEWDILSQYISYPWENNAIYKLYYDSKIKDDVIFAFVYNQEYMETTIITIPFTMYMDIDSYENYGYTNTTLNPSVLLFGKERDIFVCDGTNIFCLYGQMNGYQFFDEYIGHFEHQIIGSGSQVFAPRYIFNKTNQTYYFVNGDTRLYGLSYEKTNLPLSYGLGKVDEATTTVELMGYEIQSLKSQIEEMRNILTEHGIY